MTTFEGMRKNRKSSLQSLVTEINKTNSQFRDENEGKFWKPTVDKAGNGVAIIRFLPAPVNEEHPWVVVYDHGFQGPGGWYIENSLTTIGQQDPMSEHNSMLWNSGVESNKDLVRKQKRRKHYISNIYVVSDPANKDNEGKVFLYKYGVKIFEKVKDLMTPEFNDEEPVNPFDLWEGCNLRLKIRKVDGYRNYDKSAFDSPAPLADDDERLEEIWKSQHSLATFIDPKNFKTYDELKARMNRVLMLNGDAKPQQETFFTPSVEVPPVSDSVTAEVASQTANYENNEDLAFFERLANE